MARTPKTDAVETADFVHKGKKRTNNPPAREGADKQEQHDRGCFTVAPVVLHFLERLSARAIIGAAMREDAQRGLSAATSPPSRVTSAAGPPS